MEENKVCLTTNLTINIPAPRCLATKYALTLEALTLDGMDTRLAGRRPGMP